jgi:hypothetical protein
MDRFANATFAGPRPHTLCLREFSRKRAFGTPPCTRHSACRHSEFRSRPSFPRILGLPPVTGKLSGLIDCIMLVHILLYTQPSSSNRSHGLQYALSYSTHPQIPPPPHPPTPPHREAQGRAGHDLCRQAGHVTLQTSTCTGRSRYRPARAQTGHVTPQHMHKQVT